MNKICRICLEEGILSSIFTKNYNISLCDMIEYITNVKINKNDGLPDQLCSNCAYKLGIAYHFKQTCESSDSRWRQYLGLELTSKTKDAEIMTDPIVMTQHTIIKKCKCIKEQKKTSSNYKRKLECQKLKRGPKPKPKKEHTCYHCNKQFRCEAQLEMHIRTHTGDKPFVCMYCPRRFTQKHNLTIHLRVHTGEKPFQCDVCSKRFSAQGNLQAHLKIHTGQKDHACSMCNKSFITSSELTRHMFKHRGIKNFKCDVCGAAYIHNRDLKIHKRKKHDIKENSKAQNEYINIDIIDIDENRSAVPDKNSLANDKNHHCLPKPDISYQNKAKDDQYDNNLVHEPIACTICGESFHYMAPLAHHYLHQHKNIHV